MSTEQNSPQDDEAFQRHLREMLDKDAPENGHSDSYTNAMSNVDLNTASSVIPTSYSYDMSESPFKAPEMSASGAQSIPYSHSNPTNLTSSGAYPRPQVQPVASSKVDQIKTQVKEFTVETFRTTKQLFSEIMGKGTKTVDPQLDAAVTDLRNLQATYQKLLDETSNLHSYLSNVIYTQKQLTNVFGELAQRDTGLAEDFNCNAETQRVLIKNGEQLLGALQFFMSNMRTLCHKTMQDCLDTVKKYEYARLQYDTYRSENEQAIHSTAAATTKTAEIKEKFEERKRKYEQLKADLAVKIQFLHENKSKVVHRQMVLFHNATAAYFSGNQQQLQSLMSQFSIKLKTPNTAPPSWLEQ